MRRQLPPSVLIGIVFILAAAFFGTVIVGAIRGRSAIAQPTASAGAPIPAAPTVALANLRRSEGATYFYVDTFNRAPLVPPPPMPIPVPAGGTVTLTGWAVDTTAGTVAGGALFAIDDTTTFQATYGFDRSDIAALLKNDAYRLCGFSASLSVAGLAPGQHTIAIRILTADRTAYFAPSEQMITIDVR